MFQILGQNREIYYSSEHCYNVQNSARRSKASNSAHTMKNPSNNQLYTFHPNVTLQVVQILQVIATLLMANWYCESYDRELKVGSLLQRKPRLGQQTLRTRLSQYQFAIRSVAITCKICVPLVRWHCRVKCVQIGCCLDLSLCEQN